jgi:hypothetical protein
MILERIGERSERTCRAVEFLLRVSDEALMAFGLNRVELQSGGRQCKRPANPSFQ